MVEHNTNEVYFLSESFVSIQGEGNRAGMLSLFVRFQYCNLTCNWCDTKYTWYKVSGSFQEHTADSLRALVDAQSPTNVIFTGGEPTLYRLDRLVVPGKRYHVETHGRHIPTQPLDVVIAGRERFVRDAMDEAVVRQFNWVVSPKMANSGQPLDEVGPRFWAKQDYCIFKFIVQDEADIDEVERYAERFGLPHDRIYLSLEGKTLESQLRGDLVDVIVRRGFHYSPRLHVLLWGNRRGK